jgi:hypothetical protein
MPVHECRFYRVHLIPAFLPSDRIFADQEWLKLFSNYDRHLAIDRSVQAEHAVAGVNAQIDYLNRLLWFRRGCLDRRLDGGRRKYRAG